MSTNYQDIREALAEQQGIPEDESDIILRIAEDQNDIDRLRIQLGLDPRDSA